MDKVYDVGTDGGDFVILILMFVTAKIYFDEIKKEIETEQKISDGWRDVFASGKF